MLRIIYPPEQMVLAHQYLYYILTTPIWSDYEYDNYCKKHYIYGGGGSDLKSSYSSAIIALALNMRDNPSNFLYEEYKQI